MSQPLDYPVCLRLADRPVVLIGGGKVGAGRAQQLLEVGARLTVICPAPTEELKGWAKQGRLTLHQRAYQPGDLHGAQLAFSATDDRSVSQRVAVEARARGLWLNAADEPDLCDFTLPSVGRQGAITVAVSTDGQAPAVAARLRRQLISQLGVAPVVRVGLSGWVRRLLPRTPLRGRLLRWVAGPGPRAGTGAGAEPSRRLLRWVVGFGPRAGSGADSEPSRRLLRWVATPGPRAGTSAGSDPSSPLKGERLGDPS